MNLSTKFRLFIRQTIFSEAKSLTCSNFLEQTSLCLTGFLACSKLHVAVVLHYLAVQLFESSQFPIFHSHQLNANNVKYTLSLMRRKRKCAKVRKPQNKHLYLFFLWAEEVFTPDGYSDRTSSHSYICKAYLYYIPKHAHLHFFPPFRKSLVFVFYLPWQRKLNSTTTPAHLACFTLCLLYLFDFLPYYFANWSIFWPPWRLPLKVFPWLYLTATKY